MIFDFTIFFWGVIEQELEEPKGADAKQQATSHKSSRQEEEKDDKTYDLTLYYYSDTTNIYIYMCV